MPETVREAVAEEARRWLGTPYCHQASQRGVGCDCLGLVRGIWRAVLGDEPRDFGIRAGAYTGDWGEVGGVETVLDGAARHLLPVAADDRLPGDVIVFRWHPTTIAKHLGIVSAADRFIHAWERAGVVEVTLVPSWKSRIAAVFRFPEKG